MTAVAIDHSSRELLSGGAVARLSRIRLDQLHRFGPKAATLGQLMARGFEIPDGFGVAADAFDPDRDDPIGPMLAAEILNAYRQLRSGQVAVRSSARDEDGARASAAGIYDSLLGVHGEAPLLDAIRRCLSSAWTARARAHRSAVGAAANDQPMGILVQRMVLADVAGVAYTVDPVSARRDRLCLNATPGLGDALSSGHVSGETQLTDRTGRLIESDRLPGAPPVLTPGHAQALAMLVERLERELGGPLDIEFAFTGEHLHLLQARPVAAQGLADARLSCRARAYLASERIRLRERLKRLRAQGVLRAGEAVLSNGNIAELLPNATPISLDLFNAVFTAHGGAIARGRQRLGYRVADAGACALLETFCGQPYFNLEVDADTFDAGYPLDIPGYLAAVREDPNRANYPEFGLYEQVPTLDEARRRFGRREGRQRHEESLGFQNALRAQADRMLADWRDGLGARLERTAHQSLAIDWAGLDLAGVVGTLRERVRYLRDRACVEFVAAARLGFFFAERLRVALDGMALEDADRLRGRLLQGLDGSRITDLSLDLERLGAGKLTTRDWLGRYGHLAPNELELASPRYSEMPGTMEGLGRRLAERTPGPAQRHTGQRADRARAESELAPLLRLFGRTEEDDFRKDLRLARAFLPLRETIKFHYTAEHAAIRRGLLRLAEIRGLEPELAFHLRLRELAEPPQLSILETRREERRLGRRLLREGRLPAVILEGRIQTLGSTASQTAGRELTGRAMAPGCSVGRVRVLDLDRDDPESLLADLAGDEVLVTRSANLGLASLFRLCAGLVVEVGGVLAHAACQARESGIPAVVLENATSLLHDGMRVRLDGGRGRVSIVEPRDGNRA
jgi:rifampicin phosphotransferase